MSLIKAKELREKRAKLISEAREIINSNEELTPEQDAQVDEMLADAEKIREQYEKIERDHDRREKLEAEYWRLNDSQGVRAGRESEMEPEERAERENAAFRNYLRYGFSGLAEEEREIMIARQQSLGQAAVRALAAGTDASGGYTVPEGFYNTLMEAQLQFGGMRRARTTIITTDSGNDLPMPTENDTSNTGEIIGENQQHNAADPTFGVVTLGSYLYSSKIVRVSVQLLQDSAFNIDDYLARKLGIRIGRITNTHFTTGDGSSKPSGVVTGATSGVTAASASTIADTELIDLEHSVDGAYRQNAEFMMRDSTLKVLKKLKDGNSRLLWVPGIALRQPDTILGYPFIVNNDVAAIAASAKTILFGDFSTYHIRDVRGVTLLRLTERYADYAQVGFLAFSRHDGALVDAGTNPIKYLTMAAS